MTTYRTDPDTGAVYAFGGVYGLSRTLDEQMGHDEAVQRMIERRIGELPRRRSIILCTASSCRLLVEVRQAVHAAERVDSSGVRIGTVRSHERSSDQSSNDRGTDPL